jgi:hypothetical protein
MSGNGELAELSFYALLSLLGVAIAGIFLSIEFSRPLWFLISFSVVLSTMSSQAEFRNG